MSGTGTSGTGRNGTGRNGSGADEGGRCAELRDALTEVALGIADGTTRGAVMAHLATCDRCRDELSALAAAADELLLLAPEREPSAGFEGRVLARLTPGHPPAVRRHGARRTLLALAAAVALLAAGGTGAWLATAPDRELAAAYRTTLDVADGRYLAAADLTTGTGVSAGTVFLYEGDPSWAYVVVREAGPASGYTVTATVRDAGADAGTPDAYGARPGHEHSAATGQGAGSTATRSTRDIPLGTCTVTAGTCTAGGLLDAAVPDVVAVRLTAPDGTVWATAAPGRQPAG